MYHIKGQILRHGKTSDNTLEVMSGCRDVYLTQDGIDLLFKNKHIMNILETSRYYVTDLYRTITTFNIYFPNKKPDAIIPEFREFCFGAYEGKDIAEVADIVYDIFLNNKSNNLNVETYQQALLRYQQGLEYIIQDLINNHQNTFSLVAHNGTCRMFKSMLLGHDINNFRNFKTQNGKGIIVEFDYDQNNHQIYNGTLSLIK